LWTLPSTIRIKSRCSPSANVSSEDETAYRRSVRNTAILLLVVVIILAAGLVLPAYFSPASALPAVASVVDTNGLTLSVGINETHVSAPFNLVITAWINGSSSIENVTAKDSWAVNQSLVWKTPCVPGWPVAIGVMSGYFDQYNYTTGVLIPLREPVTDCEVLSTPPSSFLVQADGSKAIAIMNSSDETWSLQTTLVLTKASFTQTPGETFTVIGVDEWGDVAILHFVSEQSAA